MVVLHISDWLPPHVLYFWVELYVLIWAKEHTWGIKEKRHQGQNQSCSHKQSPCPRSLPIMSGFSMYVQDCSASGDRIHSNKTGPISARSAGFFFLSVLSLGESISVISLEQLVIGAPGIRVYKVLFWGGFSVSKYVTAKLLPLVLERQTEQG